MPTYTLNEPIPDIQTLSQVGDDPITEAIATTGCQIMWKDESDVVHILASFGGFTDSGWYGEYVNTDNGNHALVTGLKGDALMASYYNGKLYIGGGYQGSLAELVPGNPPVINIINDSVLGPVTSMATGDDNRIYHVGFASGSGHASVYSYDPAVGLPTGWKSYPDRSDASDSSNAMADADTTYVYFAYRRTDNKYTLASCPVSGTTWTAWTYDNTNDLGVYIRRASDGSIYIERRLADGVTTKYYSISGTTVNEISLPEGGLKSGPPLYCVAVAGQANFIQFNQYYGYDIDTADLYPVRGSHEYSRLGYKPHANPSFAYVQDDFTGTWVTEFPRVFIAMSGTTLLGLTHGYGPAFTLDYMTPSRTYLGAELLDPYEIKKHPVSAEYYAAGYASGRWRYIPSGSWTLSGANSAPVSPQEPYPPDGVANPFIYELPATIDYRYFIDFSSNDFVWMGGNTVNQSPDYGVVDWYNPVTGDNGTMFPAWTSSGAQFINLCACLNRTKILVANNKDEIIRITASTQTDDNVTINPMSDGTSRSMLIETSYDRVFVINFSTGPTYKVGILQPSTMTWVVALQPLGVSGIPFGFADGGYTREFWQLKVGPDGYVWMFVGSSLYRIDPADPTLTFNKIVDTTYGGLTFANNGQDIVIYNIGGGHDSGATYIKYIPGILDFNGYSRGNYVSLPVNDDDLETPYTDDDIVDIAINDTDMVAQLATSQIAIHQFKQQIIGTGGIISVVAQVTIPCSTSTAYLQIYNRSGTPAWDTIDSDNATGANTDFTLSASVADLTDYKDENNIVACRVYQEMQ